LVPALSTVSKRDDEGSQCGHEPDKGVNQQCEINVSHGFSLHLSALIGVT
jgi:hypothetical protein